MPDSMGAKPLSWQEIAAWAALTHRRLASWEARTLKRMSEAYLAEMHLAEDPHRAQPWVPIGQQVDHAANDRQLMAVLG